MCRIDVCPLFTSEVARSRVTDDMRSWCVPTMDVIERLEHVDDYTDWNKLPKDQLAGVLVLLFEQAGELHVLLTTRARRLRTSPGETALPGGRYEPGVDADIETTAKREAFEEIGLDLSKCQIRHLATLEPLISKTLLFVVPVVYVLTSNSQDMLNSLIASPDEVEAIFSCPLSCFSQISETADYEYTYTDVSRVNGHPYRLHSLEHPTFASAVTGLTFDILVEVAQCGHGRPANLALKAPNQPSTRALVQMVLAGTNDDTRRVTRSSSKR